MQCSWVTWDKAKKGRSLGGGGGGTLCFCHKMRSDQPAVRSYAAESKDAECFCCSHGHRHPTTSAQLPCDKRLVHKMLKEWYGEQGEHGDGAIDCSDCMYLERFNHVIREDLAPQVASLVGGFALPSNYTLYMVAVSAIPYLADHIAVFVVSLRAGTPSGYALFTWTLREASRWGVVAVASMLSVRLSLPLWKVCLRFCQNGSKSRRWCVALLAACVVFLFVAVVWGSVLFSLAHTNATNLLPVVLFSGWLALACVLHTSCLSSLLRALGIMHLRAGEAQPCTETFSV